MIYSGTVRERITRVQRAKDADHPAIGRAITLSEEEALHMTESLRHGTRETALDMISNPDLARLVNAVASYGAEPFEWPPLPEHPGFIHKDDLGCVYCGDLWARESPCRYCIQDREET